jgi:hypothetical protein
MRNCESGGFGLPCTTQGRRGCSSFRVAPALRGALPDDIALPGEPFDTTDVYIKGHKHGRYIFVWNIGSWWIVATEQGGIALRAAISTYDLGKDGKTAALVDQRFTFPGDVCAVATEPAGAKDSHRKFPPT